MMQVSIEFIVMANIIVLLSIELDYRNMKSYIFEVANIGVTRLILYTLDGKSNASFRHSKYKILATAEGKASSVIGLSTGRA